MRAGMKRKAPPMRRMSEDARPLSSVEMDIHRNLIQTHSSPDKQRPAHTTAPRTIGMDQRKLIETQLRNRIIRNARRNAPYSQSVTQSELTGSSQVPMTPTVSMPAIPMTPAIAPTTISLTAHRPHSTTPGSSGISSGSSRTLATHDESLLRLSPDSRHLFTRSLSQPANLLRPRTMPSSRQGAPVTQISREREQRAMMRHFANIMAESRNSTNPNTTNNQNQNSNYQQHPPE